MQVREGDPFGDIFAAEFWPKVLAKIWATISEHQQTITGYLRLRPFDDAEAAQLEQWSNSSSRRPAVWNKPPPLWARRGSFLKSGARSSPLLADEAGDPELSGLDLQRLLRDLRRLV